MNIFLSTPFSSKVDSDGVVITDYRHSIERLISGLRSKGHSVFCALEHTNWNMNGVALPEDEFRKDLDEIDKADVLLVLLEERVSAGVQIESGYAYAKGKALSTYQIGAPAWSNIAFSRMTGHEVIAVQSVNDFVVHALNSF